MIIEELVILGRNDAADADKDIIAAPFLKFFYQGREQSLMACSQRGETNNMNIVIYGILRRFFRCLEERAHIDIPAHIGKGGCQYFLASIVAILAHLAEEDTWTAAFEFFEFVNQELCTNNIYILID